MAEGLSEIQFRRTAMRSLALILISILPFAGAIAARADIPPHVARVDRPMFLLLVNIMSAQRRQIRLKTGVVDLPPGVRVTVESRVGETLYIVSDTNASFDERIPVKPGDDARILRIR
jgi:hypothetical protein